MTWLWLLVLIIAAFLAHWGAEQLSAPLKALRQRFGFSAAGGGALVALGSASPDVAISTVSAVTGVGGIGLGNMLGSNVLSIPVAIAVVYFATRKRSLGTQSGVEAEHDQHAREGLLRASQGSVTLIALPYLVIIALFAMLTVPSGWRGLQPVDGWIMTAAYLVFLAQALLRRRGEGQQVQWSSKKTWLALGGLLAIALGSYLIVTATRQIASALGIPLLVSGLFLTATMTALPAWFAARSVARAGQVTPAVTSQLADNTMALSVAALPLALITVPVQNFPVFVTVLSFVAVMPVLFAVLVHTGRGEHGFTKTQVWIMLAALAAYLVTVAVVLVLT